MTGELRAEKEDVGRLQSDPGIGIVVIEVERALGAKRNLFVDS
jgi:hypothetical protein